MERRLALTCAIALALVGCARTGRDGEPPKHFTGIWTEFYKSGKRETSYKNGEEDGRFTEWYKDGSKSEEGEYRAGCPVGTWTSWYRSGGKRSEELHEPGADETQSLITMTEWHENGQPYLKGQEAWATFGRVRQGTWRIWNPDGELIAEGVYRDGKPLDGVFQEGDAERHEDGSSSITFTRLVFKTFKNGVATGPLLIFDTEWRRLVKGELKDDKPHGEYTWWNSMGEVTAQGVYRDGSPWNGTFETPWRDGEFIGEAWYRDRKLYRTYREGFLVGERMGLEPKWQRPWGSPEGHTRTWPLVHEELGNRGEVVLVDGERDGRETWWDAKGRTIAEGIFRKGIPWNGTFYSRERDESSAGYSLCLCQNGIRQRICKFRGPQGIREREVNYREGKLHGELVVWHGDGQKGMEVTYVNGQRHGLYTRWHWGVIGQKDEEGAYRGGKQHGVWRRWSIKGELLGEWRYKEGKLWEGIYARWSANYGDWSMYDFCTYKDGKLLKHVERSYYKGELMTEGDCRDSSPEEGTFFRDGQVRTYERGRLIATRKARPPH